MADADGGSSGYFVILGIKGEACYYTAAGTHIRYIFMPSEFLHYQTRHTHKKLRAIFWAMQCMQCITVLQEAGRDVLQVLQVLLGMY